MGQYGDNDGIGHVTGWLARLSHSAMKECFDGLWCVCLCSCLAGACNGMLLFYPAWLFQVRPFHPDRKQLPNHSEVAWKKSASLTLQSQSEDKASDPLSLSAPPIESEDNGFAGPAKCCSQNSNSLDALSPKLGQPHCDNDVAML